MASVPLESLDWLDDDVTQAIVREIGAYDPQPAVVLAHALVEEQVRRLVVRSTVPDRGPGSPRSESFLSLCWWAQRLGLIDAKLRIELLTFARIRDAFAHAASHTLDFESPEVASLIDELSSLNSVFVAFQKKPPDAPGPKIEDLYVALSSKRSWWLGSFGAILLMLRTKASAARAPNPPDPSW